jgi:hypothetical protein
MNSSQAKVALLDVVGGVGEQPLCPGLTGAAVQEIRHAHATV